MDRYNLTARIYPMVLFYLPLSVFLIVSIWDFQNYFHFGIPIIVLSLLAYLSSHLGRDAGKLIEKNLWKDWGGAPTTQLFRWRNSSVDYHTKLRRHQKMEVLCPIGIQIDQNYESNNLSISDDAYISWTKFIIAKTRDTTKYSLIFRENIAYGFRRNLLGLKPYAISLLLLLMATTYVFFWFKLKVCELNAMPKVFYFAESFLLLFLLFWIIIVTKNWVKLTAFSYAERLQESIDIL